MESHLSENNYFKVKAVSNSLLGALSNPRWLKIKMDNPEVEDEEKVHFRIGSALDCQLTSPELWEEQFLVIDATRPMGFMGKFIDNLPPNLDFHLDGVEKYEEAYRIAGYKMNITKVIEKLWNTPELLEYYLSTRNIDRNKQILSKEEFEAVTKAKELLLANKFTAPYFFTNAENTDGMCELLSQVPIYFKYMGEDCKALLDGILINHEAKTIQPYDLKTTGKSVYEFESAYLNYGYYRQCAFYELAMKQPESPVYNLIEEGYKILDFVFIVVESKITSTRPAIIYRTIFKDRLRGLAGGFVGSKYYKGIIELMEAYQYHKNNDYWDLPMDIAENKGEIELNIFDNN